MTLILLFEVMAEASRKFSGTKKICKHCKKIVAEPVDCNTCGSSFHPSCGKQAKVINSEKILDCCGKRGNCEVRTGEFNIAINMDEKKLKIIIRETLKEMLNPFKKTITDEIQQLRVSVQYMSDAFDDYKVKFETISDEMKAIRRENEMLKEKTGTLEMKVNNMEQIEKQNNIVMSGIPEQSEEVNTIMKKVMKALKVEIEEGDIVDCFKIGKTGRSPILVKLRNSETKTKIFKAVKRTKGIKVNEYGLAGTNNNIYFNDDLTHQNQILLKKARIFGKNKKYKNIFCSRGKIYVVKTDNDPPIRIYSEEDLQ